MKKKILYVYRTARSNSYKQVLKNQEPDHLLYGLNHLAHDGFNVSFFDDAYHKSNFLYWIFYPIQRFIIHQTSIGFKLDQALLLISQIRTHDLIVTTADSAGLPILFLKKLKLINKPVIYISTGLINEISLRRNIFKLLYKEFLKKADIIVCHAPIERELFLALDKSFEVKLRVLPFGIDINFFKCNRKKEEFILSVGRDRSRDYALLAKAAKHFPNEQFVIVTSKSNIKNINFPRNVDILFDLPYIEVKKLYCKAKLVFLPLKEINRAEGQIAYLEAIASKNKIVVASVVGLINIYKIPIQNVYLFKPSNEKAAVTKIKEALKKTYKKSLFPKYSSRAYANEIKKLVNNLI